MHFIAFIQEQKNSTKLKVQQEIFLWNLQTNPETPVIKKKTADQKLKGIERKGELQDLLEFILAFEKYLFNIILHTKALTNTNVECTSCLRHKEKVVLEDNCCFLMEISFSTT